MYAKKLRSFELEFEGKTRKEIAQAVDMSEHSLNCYFAKQGRWHEEYANWAKVKTSDLEGVIKNKFFLCVSLALDVILNGLQTDDKNSKLALNTAVNLINKSYSTISQPKLPQRDDSSERFAAWLKESQAMKLSMETA